MGGVRGEELREPHDHVLAGPAVGFADIDVMPRLRGVRIELPEIRAAPPPELVAHHAVVVFAEHILVAGREDV